MTIPSFTFMYHERKTDMLTNLMETILPATGEKISEVVETPLEEIHPIYEKARNAFSDWSRLSLKDRLAYFRKLRLVMTEKMDHLAQVISKDTGKSLTEAITADVMPTIDAILHLEQEAPHVLKRQKMKTPLMLWGKKSYVEYMPMGVVLVISPWNYPMNLSMVPMLSALVSGNTVLLKPSEVTPLVGKEIERLFHIAGFPDGVVQVVHGGKEVGAALTEGKPDYIFFTGSVRTGKIIQQVAAKNLIPTTLELGGKDPMIVFEDAPLERAVKGAVWGAFTNSGQVCMSTERLFVHKSILPQFVQMLKKEVANLKRGTGPNDDIGAMTYLHQVEIVKRHVEDALQKGATLETGTPPETWDGTMFLPLMVLSNVTTDMDIVNEETFGPILPIIPFETEEEAIQLANQSDYGLNSSVWSKDLEKAKRVASQLVAGNVVINDVIVSVANHHLPFGGVKHSGIGRYHGTIGILTFCHTKSIMVDKGTKPSEIQWYPYNGKYELFLSLFRHYFGEKRNWLGFMKDYLTLLKMTKNS
jgi:acyl-CoA reductase-like NAD-dependent aldehyde dehydrogenase